MFQGGKPSFKVGGRSLVFPCIQVGRSKSNEHMFFAIFVQLLNVTCTLQLFFTYVILQTIQKIPLNVMTLEIVTKRVYTAKVNPDFACLSVLSKYCHEHKVVK